MLSRRIRYNVYDVLSTNNAAAAAAARRFPREYNTPRKFNGDIEILYIIFFAASPRIRSLYVCVCVFFSSVLSLDAQQQQQQQLATLIRVQVNFSLLYAFLCL